jgi:hypothetical protein
MRYYAEWLDGEYLLLRHVNRGYDHNAVVQRALRFHAVFGSTVVASDAQLVDYRVGVPKLFADPDFRSFLHERQVEGFDFLALVADAMTGLKDEKLAISMRGVGRLIDQADKPPNSYEAAATRFGEALLNDVSKSGTFEKARYLRPARRSEARVGKIIREYSEAEGFDQYARAFTGLLHATEYFSKCSLPTTTTTPKGNAGRYDELLLRARDEARVVSEKQHERTARVLDFQNENVRPELHGRRAAIRKELGQGQWQNETWEEENLRLYLDVVHVWNCVVAGRISPEAGTLYESYDDLPLSRYQRSVTDVIGWFSAAPMPASALSARLRRFLSWDPLDSDWKHIAFIVRSTRKTARQLQDALKNGSEEDRIEALTEHASRVADYLVEIREVPELVWWVVKAVGDVTSYYPSELVEAAEAADGAYALALLQRKLVVNTLTKAGFELLLK